MKTQVWRSRVTVFAISAIDIALSFYCPPGQAAIFRTLITQVALVMACLSIAYVAKILGNRCWRWRQSISRYCGDCQSKQRQTMA
ncbi:hypothetical protein [Dyella humicola]|uniref:hypothetical protein n=1 Tax=Dyella humicola TaxID=2992126 RepID=UPI00225998A1|nr:hypothetical protein [Dyella humicola]